MSQKINDEFAEFQPKPLTSAENAVLWSLNLHDLYLLGRPEEKALWDRSLKTKDYAERKRLWAEMAQIREQSPPPAINLLRTNYVDALLKKARP